MIIWASESECSPVVALYDDRGHLGEEPVQEFHVEQHLLVDGQAVVAGVGGVHPGGVERVRLQEVRGEGEGGRGRLLNRATRGEGCGLHMFLANIKY